MLATALLLITALHGAGAVSITELLFNEGDNAGATLFGNHP
ncbi:hypothetical protein ykris0001_23990 [Yersinia kristensenii ATCC 33638]|nr:hypothetical protein ykris0001_23990 [Yersinia kristensenii ATCC 33638]